MNQRRQATATRGSPVLRRQSAVTMAGPLIQFRPSPSLNESVNGPEVCNLALKLRCSITRNAGHRALHGGSAELRLQFHQIGEDVALATRLVRDHRRPA